MRRLAVTSAGLAFFLFAIVAWASGLRCDEVAMKAAGGAAGVFVIVLLGGRVVLNVVVDALLAARAAKVSKESSLDDRDE